MTNYTTTESFDVHLPNLIRETIEGHPHPGPLVMAWSIAQVLIALVAQRASELNDPALNILMLRLMLYDVEPEVERRQRIDEQRERARKHGILAPKPIIVCKICGGDCGQCGGPV